MSDTFELVSNGKAMLAIIKVATNAGFSIISADNHQVTVKSGCLPVRIAWEMCLCHGGRLWFNQEETGIHIELSSDEYDEENGVCSPETELAWRIDNELVDTVNGFRSFVHVVDTKGNYGNPDRSERHYFDSVDKAARFIFDEGGVDLLACDEIVHKYPNQNIQMRVTALGDERESGNKARRIRFKCERLTRKDQTHPFSVEYEFTQEYWVYRKGLR